MRNKGIDWERDLEFDPLAYMCRFDVQTLYEYSVYCARKAVETETTYFSSTNSNIEEIGLSCENPILCSIIPTSEIVNLDLIFFELNSIQVSLHRQLFTPTLRPNLDETLLEFVPHLLISTVPLLSRSSSHFFLYSFLHLLGVDFFSRLALCPFPPSNLHRYLHRINVRFPTKSVVALGLDSCRQFPLAIALSMPAIFALESSQV